MHIKLHSHPHPHRIVGVFRLIASLIAMLVCVGCAQLRTGNPDEIGTSSGSPELVNAEGSELGPDQTANSGPAEVTQDALAQARLAKSNSQVAKHPGKIYSDYSDIWQRVRAGFRFPPIDNSLVHEWENYYASRPEYFARMIHNSSHFLYHITGEVERRGMPLEIALLPMIESAFNPVAYSSAHASGIWQFIPSTGKNYGLRRNGWYDGRRDIIAATGAALDYLQNLHSMFNDWELALASYNWGEGAVQRAVERNQARGLPIDFQSLTNVPAETRNYIPKLIAIKNIIAAPERYGLSLAHVPNEPYFDVVAVNRHIDVARAAHFADMPLDEFKFLNPAHSRLVINADTAKTILLPKDKVEQFDANMAIHEDLPLTKWQTHVVRAGERAQSIAARYNMTLAELNEVNKLSSRRRIATGQTLLVSATSAEVNPQLANLPVAVPVKARRAPSRAKSSRARAKHSRGAKRKVGKRRTLVRTSTKTNKSAAQSRQKRKTASTNMRTHKNTGKSHARSTRKVKTATAKTLKPQATSRISLARSTEKQQLE